MIAPYRRLLWPGLMTAIMLLGLIGLGTWQVQRLFWKQALLDQIARAEAAPPEPFTGVPKPFAKLSVTGIPRDDLPAYFGAEVRTLPTGARMGARLIVPLERPGEPPLLVDRGWVPLPGHVPSVPRGQPVTIIGFAHQPETSGLFSATDDVLGRRFYALDPAKIGLALGLPRVEGFILVELNETGAPDGPIPARHLPVPPNNHAAYALIWFGLAVVLAGIFIIWARKGTSS